MKRLPVHNLDPSGGADGEGIVIDGGKFVIGPVGLVGGGSPIGGGGIPAQYNLFGPEPRTAHALTQTSTGGYVWPGEALNGNTGTFRFDLGLRRAAYARWIMVWKPMASYNALRIVHHDSGPTNVTQIAEITGLTDTTPVVSTVDITTDINALFDGGIEKRFSHQINAGATGPVIYVSRLEIVWEGAAAETHVTMPLTTVVGGVPELVWGADDSLIPTEVPL